MPSLSQMPSTSFGCEDPLKMRAPRIVGGPRSVMFSYCAKCSDGLVVELPAISLSYRRSERLDVPSPPTFQSGRVHWYLTRDSAGLGRIVGTRCKHLRHTHDEVDDCFPNC
jgi:hypothetical protein